MMSTLDDAMPLLIVLSLAGGFFGIGLGQHLYEEHFLRPAGWPLKDVWWGMGGFFVVLVVFGGGGFFIIAEVAGAIAITLSGSNVIHVGH